MFKMPPTVVKIPQVIDDITISRREYLELVGVCKMVLDLPLDCSKAKIEVLKLRAHRAKLNHKKVG
jgi:hypothetical protein